MKRYRVWMANMCAIDIEAKTIDMVSINDRPLKIRFVGEDDYTLAEFYCDKMNGWGRS